MKIKLIARQQGTKTHILCKINKKTSIFVLPRKKTFPHFHEGNCQRLLLKLRQQ